jgi:predicted DNA-binding transcriptional regulator
MVSPGPKARRALSGVGDMSVAKQRIVNTKFWDDSYIVNLNPKEKLIFLYLFTNPVANISGVYELPLERVAFDTGISRQKVEESIKKFEVDRKIVCAYGWIGVVNFIKHQNRNNPKIRQGILAELEHAPKEIVDRLSIDYEKLGISKDGQSHLNSNLKPNPNLNPNPNSNTASPKRVLTSFPQEIEEGIGELVRKWRM